MWHVDGRGGRGEHKNEGRVWCELRGRRDVAAWDIFEWVVKESEKGS